jgi:hypothetical protein
MIRTEQLPDQAATALKSIAMNGTPELISTQFVDGLKHLLIRYGLC